MALRNWWVEGTASGRKHPVTLGPRGVGGDMDIDIYQRVQGASVRVARIQGRYIEGRLELEISVPLNEKGVEVSSVPMFNNKITLVRSQR